MNLTEALHRWAELERYRCRECIDGSFDISWSKGDFLFLPNTSVQAWLEYAVREAIEARGVDWVVERADSGIYFARVNRTADARFLWEQGAASNSSAAHALLEAYIAYLEANAI